MDADHVVSAVIFALTFTVVPLPPSTARSLVSPVESVIVHPSNQLFEAEKAPRKVVWVRKEVSARV